MLIVPGAAGEIGVLARHAPLIAMLKAGSTRVHVKRETEVQEFATGPGFFKVEQDRALALVDDAVDAREIDDARAREQLEAARAELEASSAASRKRPLADRAADQARREPAGGRRASDRRRYGCRLARTWIALKGSLATRIEKRLKSPERSHPTSLGGSVCREGGKFAGFHPRALSPLRGARAGDARPRPRPHDAGGGRRAGRARPGRARLRPAGRRPRPPRRRHAALAGHLPAVRRGRRRARDAAR